VTRSIDRARVIVVPGLAVDAYADQSYGAGLVLMPGVSHSWPKADSARFLRFIDQLQS
jgi:hypothetical protein